jgi:hypothetical protein
MLLLNICPPICCPRHRPFYLSIHHFIAGIFLSTHARQCQQCKSALWVSFWVLMSANVNNANPRHGYLFEYLCLHPYQQCPLTVWISFWVPLLRWNSRFVELIIVCYLKFPLWLCGYLFKYLCLYPYQQSPLTAWVSFWVPLLRCDSCFVVFDVVYYSRFHSSRCGYLFEYLWLIMLVTLINPVSVFFLWTHIGVIHSF